MRLCIAALTATVALAAGPEPAKVPRAKVANAEKMINTKLAGMYPDEPYFVIGFTRGVYLEGVGVMFSAELNLATGAMPTPFHPTITKEEIAAHREKKQARLPLLRTAMYSVLNTMGSYLEMLPPTEEVIFAVTLLRYPWEDPAAAPSQIIMRAPRAKLRQAKPEEVTKVQEY